MIGMLMQEVANGEEAVHEPSLVYLGGSFLDSFLFGHVFPFILDSHFRFLCSFV